MNFHRTKLVRIFGSFIGLLSISGALFSQTYALDAPADLTVSQRVGVESLQVGEGNRAYAGVVLSCVPPAESNWIEVRCANVDDISKSVVVYDTSRDYLYDGKALFWFGSNSEDISSNWPPDDAFGSIEGNRISENWSPGETYYYWVRTQGYDPVAQATIYSDWAGPVSAQIPLYSILPGRHGVISKIGWASKGEVPVVGRTFSGGLGPYNDQLQPLKYYDAITEQSYGVGNAAKTFFPASTQEGEFFRWFVNVVVENRGDVPANFTVRVVDDSVNGIELGDLEFRGAEEINTRELASGETQTLTFQLWNMPHDDRTATFQFRLFERDGLLDANEVDKTYDYEVCLDATAPHASVGILSDEVSVPDDLPLSVAWSSGDDEESDGNSPLWVSLFRSENGGASESTLLDRTSVLSGTYEDNQLSAGNQYAYRVEAIDAVGHSSSFVYSRGSLPIPISASAYTESVLAVESNAGPIVFTRELQSVAVLPGESVELSFAVSGSVDSIKWYKDGALVQEGGYSYLIASAQESDEAVYSVEVSDGTTSVNSECWLLIEKPDAEISGNLMGMGDGRSGLLGNNEEDFVTRPIFIRNNVNRISAGNEHNLFVTADGTLMGMGTNSFDPTPGTVTTYKVGSHSTPFEIDEGIGRIAAGKNHSLYLDGNGNLMTMGFNVYGELGDGTDFDRYAPREIDKEVKAVDAGLRYTSLYLKENGILMGMGNNQFGQLGDGSNTDRFDPVEIASRVRSFSVGARHSLYLTIEGVLMGMGYDKYGNLGDGDRWNNIVYESPIEIARGVKTVSAGDGYSLYLEYDGTLMGMGRNDFGQLGDGTTENRYHPIEIAQNVKAISAGGRHSLYLTEENTLMGMGNNAYGELGDGTTVTRLHPIEIARDVIAISAGFAHTLYLQEEHVLMLPNWQDYPYRTKSFDYFSVQWDPVDGASGYHLDVAIDPSFASDTILADYNNKLIEGQNYASIRIDNVNDVNRSMTFYIRVRAGTASGTSAPSETLIFKFDPVIENFRLDAGAAATVDQTVTLNFDTSNGIPTHYRASESSEMEGVPWQSYDSNTVPIFALSPGLGLKTVYLELSHDLGESGVMSDSIERVDAAAPVVSVFDSAGAVEIVNGDLEPSLGDGTDFGSVDYAGGSVARTFLVRNTGSSNLSLTDLVSSHSDFFVSGLAPSIPAGGSDTFTVEFAPSSGGTKTATISFTNNDSDENPFNFTVSGEGISDSELSQLFDGFSVDSGPAGSRYPPLVDSPSEVSTTVVTVLGAVTGFSESLPSDLDVELLDGDSLLNSGEVRHLVEFLTAVSFEVYNPGQPNAGTPVPDSQVYVAGYLDSSERFVVISPDFQTLAELDNWFPALPVNDPAWDAVERSEIIAASEIDYGEVEIGSLSASKQFRLHNRSDALMSVSGTSESSEFIVGGLPRQVQSGGSELFTVSFNPDSVGSKSASIRLITDDPQEGEFVFEVIGAGIALEGGLAPTADTILERLPGQTINDADFTSASRFDWNGELGDWSYVKSSENTGTLTQTYDAYGNNPGIYREETILTFTTATSGTYIYREYDSGLLDFETSGSFDFPWLENDSVISLDKSSLTHGSGSNPGQTVEVSANVAWNATSSEGWLTLLDDYGDGDDGGNGSFRYALNENTSPESRTGTITVTGGGLSEVFTVNQRGSLWSGSNTWYSGSAEVGGGWLFYDWFKGFKPVGGGWYFHARLGWLYGLGQDATGIFFWDSALQRWFWTNQNAYPWLYMYGPEQNWYFFFEGGRPGSRFFKRGDNGQVVSEEDLSLNP